ncbi:MAG: hydrogenase iron-sulfur subunit [Deltaproteobacteria bacterium]|nr:hydrogenase iron-sulfur subunit [Deltaproteobacteria bacterium]
MNEKIKVVVLACGQALPEPQGLRDSLAGAGLAARVVAEPCSSKIEVYQLLRILAREADMVWMIGCPETACQYLEGSSRMSKRVAYAQNYLIELNLEPQRLGMSIIAPGDAGGLKGVIAQIAEMAQVLGPLAFHAAGLAAKESTQ